MTNLTARQRWLYFLVGACMFLASIVVEIGTVRVFLAALSITSWPTTEGIVRRSEMESFDFPRRYAVHLAYTYNVNGTAYESTSVRTRGTSSKNKSDLAALVERFPVGSKCVVFYNRDDPTVSYLEAGVGFINYVIIISPLAFAFIGAVLVWEMWKGDVGVTPRKIDWATTEPGVGADSR